ncbi:MAG: hypothetical protein HY608_09660 [Planctomycetes bacterium]|nr:hypothetical protein [Planctomycetota bacterium]
MRRGGWTLGTWIRTWIAACAIAALLDGVRTDSPFHYDDIHAIREHAWLRAERPTLAELISPLERFLVLASQRVDLLAHALASGEPSPIPLHVGQWLWHGLNATLLARLLLTLSGITGATACLAAALFLSHPAQAESVSYLTGRSELVAGAFALLALLLDARGRTWAAAIACTLALFAKPHTVALPILVWLWRRASGRPGFPWACLLPVAAGAVWMIHAGMLDDDADFLERTIEQVGRLPGVWERYAAWILWPSHHAIKAHPTEGSAWAGAALLLALAGLAFHGVGFPTGRARLGWTFAIVALLPTASIVPLNEPMSEHRLYLPLAGATLGAAVALLGPVSKRPWKVREARGVLRPAVYCHRIFRTGAAAAIALLLSGAGFAASGTAWRDDRTLWSAQILLRPTYSDAQFSLAAGLLEPASPGRAALAGAETALRHSLLHDPYVPEALQNLAVLYGRTGRFAEAVALAHNLEQHPDTPHRTRLRAAALRRSLLREAVADAERRLAASPDDPEALNNKAYLLQLQGDPGAEALFRRAINLAPGDARLHHNLGALLAEGGRLAEAESCFVDAIGIDPAYAKAYVHLGNCRLTLRGAGEAERCYRMAIELDPGNLLAWKNLTAMYLQAGDLPRAREANREALRLDPTDHAALTHRLQIETFDPGEAR